jgi:hypothetical protein
MIEQIDQNKTVVTFGNQTATICLNATIDLADNFKTTVKFREIFLTEDVQIGQVPTDDQVSETKSVEFVFYKKESIAILQELLTLLHQDLSKYEQDKQTSETRQD